MCSVETKTVTGRLQVQLKSKTLLKLYTRVLKIKKLTRIALFFGHHVSKMASKQHEIS